MKRIYLFSGMLSSRTSLSKNAIYLFFRTLAVFVLSLAAAVLLSCFAKIIGYTMPELIAVLSGWITVAFGFFGGILFLMRQN